MALIHCDFYSEALGVSTSMYVILPQNTFSQIGMESKASEGKYPVLFLLHGLTDDHTMWLRRTSIERYAAAMGLAVVMPAAGRSFYTDMERGYNYWTFISEELPAIVRSFFPISGRREDNFAAGLSMGGYGAFKLVLRCPEKFAAGASLSGALDIRSFGNLTAFEAKEFENIFGSRDKIEGSENDIFHLAAGVAKSKEAKPKLFQCCGTEDFLYKDNVKFRDHCEGVGLGLTYEEEPGAHEWGYWDKKIQRVLEWLPFGENR